MMSGRSERTLFSLCLALALLAGGAMAREPESTNRQVRQSQSFGSKSWPQQNKDPNGGSRPTEAIQVPGQQGGAKAGSKDPGALLNPCQFSPVPKWCNQ